MTYTPLQRSVPEMYILPDCINMELLCKAVWLNNSIFRVEKKPYREKLLCNNTGTTIYFCPAGSETILEMNAHFGRACSIVYDAVVTYKNITVKEMQELNITKNMAR